MLKDVVEIENNDDYLVFFNYEFVLCLLELGIFPNRITYIANHNDSYLLTRDGMAGRSGMRTILFDKTIYEKYSYRKQWKEYIMNKLNGKKDFIAVGNIPFTINSTDSSNSKKIGNDFIKLMNEFKKACYILPAKFDSKTFKEELILNPKLTKIVYHESALFDIEKSYKTCHVLLNDKPSNTFIYTSNSTTFEELLVKEKNLELSKIIGKSIYVDSSKSSLSDLWIRGNYNDTDLKSKGKYKVINKIGNNSGQDDFSFLCHDEEKTGIGKWKVVIPNVTNGWAVKVAGPDYSISYSIVGFELPNKKSAYKLKKYLLEDETIKMIKSLKTSAANTKTLFSKILLPDGLI
jgi:hypothetical protein